MIINEEQDDSKEGKTQTNEKKYFQNQRWDSQSYLRTTNDQYFVNGYLTTSVIKTLRLPYGVTLKLSSRINRDFQSHPCLVTIKQRLFPCLYSSLPLNIAQKCHSTKRKQDSEHFEKRDD